MTVTPVILAGGKASRFGSPKQDIPVGHETLLQRTQRVMQEALGAAPVVITRDIHPGHGPMGGLETAFAQTSTTAILVVACDMPGLDPALLRLLAEDPSGAHVVAPRVGRRIHPLCARWSRSTEARIKAAVASNQGTLMALLDELTVHLIDEAVMNEHGIDPQRALWNVNRPGDLQGPAR